MNCQECMNCEKAKPTERNGKIIQLYVCKWWKRYISSKFFERLPLRCKGYKKIDLS